MAAFVVRDGVAYELSDAAGGVALGFDLDGVEACGMWMLWG